VPVIAQIPTTLALEHNATALPFLNIRLVFLVYSVFYSCQRTNEKFGTANQQPV